MSGNNSAPKGKNPNNGAPNNSGNNNKAGGGGAKEAKSKAKRDEVAVMKLFSVATSAHNDEFNQWCTAALSRLSSTVDSLY